METQNRLLQSLAENDRERLFKFMRPVAIKQGAVLYEPGDHVEWVYFPEQGLVSLLSVMLSGIAVETAVVGIEGGVGFLEAIGAGVTFSRALVQMDLLAVRVPAEAYVAAFDASPAHRATVSNHLELSLAEARQTLACQTVHSHHQRLAWWLLECQDRTGGESTLPLKQDFLATMLGIQRSAVSEVASYLKDVGLITYTRGVIKVIDRPGLERQACECYATNQHFRHLIETLGRR